MWAPARCGARAIMGLGKARAAPRPPGRWLKAPRPATCWDQAGGGAWRGGGGLLTARCFGAVLCSPLERATSGLHDKLIRLYTSRVTWRDGWRGGPACAQRSSSAHAATKWRGGVIGREAGRGVARVREAMGREPHAHARPSRAHPLAVTAATTAATAAAA